MGSTVDLSAEQVAAMTYKTHACVQHDDSWISRQESCQGLVTAQHQEGGKGCLYLNKCAYAVFRQQQQLLWPHT